MWLINKQIFPVSLVIWAVLNMGVFSSVYMIGLVASHPTESYAGKTPHVRIIRVSKYCREDFSELLYGYWEQI